MGTYLPSSLSYPVCQFCLQVGYKLSHVLYDALAHSAPIALRLRNTASQIENLMGWIMVKIIVTLTAFFCTSLLNAIVPYDHIHLTATNAEEAVA